MYKVEIRGLVQGVGFRPFIYNLALSMELKGYVTNNSSGVLIVVETTKKVIDVFVQNIKTQRPELSEIEFIYINTWSCKGMTRFKANVFLYVWVIILFSLPIFSQNFDYELQNSLERVYLNPETSQKEDFNVFRKTFFAEGYSYKIN